MAWERTGDDEARQWRLVGDDFVGEDESAERVLLLVAAAETV